MKVVLYMAVTTDGYIAKRNDDTGWVSDTDWKIFSQMVKDSGCVVMGRRTYEVSGKDFPYDCDLNIVVTRNKSFLKDEKGVWFTNLNPAEIVKEAEKRGFSQMLVIGGGEMNISFLNEKLIDEIWLSVHPKILGDGIKIFEGGEADVDLTLIGIKESGPDLVQLIYKVKK